MKRLLVACLLLSGSAHAQTVFSCKGPDGQKVFSQQPCGADAVELVVKTAPPSEAPAASIASMETSSQLKNAEYAERRCRDAVYRDYGDPIDRRITGHRLRMALLTRQLASVRPTTIEQITWASGARQEIATLQGVVATELASIDPQLAPGYDRCARQRAMKEDSILQNQ